MITNCQFELPKVSVDWLLRRYKSEKTRRKWYPIYSDLLSLAERLAAPAALCREFSLDQVTLLSEWFPPQTRAVVLGLCTLGPQLDDHIEVFATEDLAAAVILNDIALALINALTRSLHASIRRESAVRGFKAGAAYRPGVGRWPLETQQVIFDRLPHHQIGITLDEHHWMTPIKSTSLIIPLLEKSK